METPSPLLADLIHVPRHERLLRRSSRRPSEVAGVTRFDQFPHHLEMGTPEGSGVLSLDASRFKADQEQTGACEPRQGTSRTAPIKGRPDLRVEGYTSQPEALTRSCRRPSSAGPVARR